MTNDDRTSCTERDCSNCAWNYLFGEDDVCMRVIDYSFPSGCVCVEMNEGSVNGWNTWCDCWNHRSNPHRDAAIMAFHCSPLRDALVDEFYKATV